MTGATRPAGARGLQVAGLAQTVVGAAALARPDQLTRAICGGGATPAPWIVRVLGARMIAQGTITAAFPSRSLAFLGVGADLLHATSMLVVARTAAQYRRPALASAAVAIGFAAAFGGTAPARRRVGVRR